MGRAQVGQQPQPGSRTVSSQPSGRRQAASLSSEQTGQRMAVSDKHSATSDRAPNTQRPQEDGATSTPRPGTMAAPAPARNPVPLCVVPPASPLLSECGAAFDDFVLQQKLDQQGRFERSALSRMVFDIFSWLLFQLQGHNASAVLPLRSSYSISQSRNWSLYLI